MHVPSVPKGPSGAALFEAQHALIERVIASVCSRRRVQPSDAEDFASFVKVKLLEKDYAVLSAYTGRSSLRTYLTVVIQRLFLDYRNAMWGKWRPSAQARRMGPLAKHLEQLLVRDGYSFEEAYELLRTNYRVAVDRAELEALAARLPARVRRRIESEDALADMTTDGPPTDATVAEAERAALAARISAALQKATLALPARDRLLLALRFQDGRTVADIADLLRVDQKGLYRHLDRVLKSLRSTLQAEGVESEAVMEIFESQAVSIEWMENGEETTAARPSMADEGQGWR